MNVRALAFSLLLSSPALSQTDSAGADALFSAGQAALKRGDFATACQKFDASQKLEKSDTTLVLIADCEARAGKLADASVHYREAIEGLAKDNPKDPQILDAKARLAKIEKRIPRLTVRLAAGSPDGSVVKRDGVELAVGSLGEALPVNAGEHRIAVTAPGRKESSVNVTTEEGKSTEITAEAGQAIVDVAGATTAGEGQPPRNHSGRALGYGLLIGGGSIALGGFALALVERLSMKTPSVSGCDAQRVCDTADQQSTANVAARAANEKKTPVYVGVVVGALGAVTAGAGALLLLSESDTGNVSIALVPGRVSVVGSFLCVD